MGKEFSQRPSDLIDIDDEFAAFCFDEAAAIWGHWVESQVREAGRQTKNERSRVMFQTNRLQQILSGGSAVREGGVITDPFKRDKPEAPPPKGKFRDPATMFERG